MRVFFAAFVLGAALLGAASAQAERKMFIVANNANGYGVDRCLASGASCGAPIAAAYCRSREFNQAVSYHKIDKDDVTGAVPTGAAGSCRLGLCEEFVAIECSR
ncbi:MAG: hypothetical protein QOD40_1400 [Alphaproteobacteria bacterium]|jgi:uncharacterized low-complexity protein|nr:hypothetical protein [Alphaproteobacteria bacterium]